MATGGGPEDTTTAMVLPSLAVVARPPDRATGDWLTMSPAATVMLVVEPVWRTVNLRAACLTAAGRVSPTRRDRVAGGEELGRGRRAPHRRPQGGHHHDGHHHPRPPAPTGPGAAPSAPSSPAPAVSPVATVVGAVDAAPAAWAAGATTGPRRVRSSGRGPGTG